MSAKTHDEIAEKITRLAWHALNHDNDPGKEADGCAQTFATLKSNIKKILRRTEGTKKQALEVLERLKGGITPEMCLAGSEVTRGWWMFSVEPEGAKDIFRAMIDAKIKEVTG